MKLEAIAYLIYFYGLFLIICGITSIIFIGLKAKTALASGGTSGIIALALGYFSVSYTMFAIVAAIILTSSLFIVFSWRSTKTLFKLFELIQSNSPDLKGKGIAFLIISLMAVVSLFLLLLLVVSLASNTFN